MIPTSSRRRYRVGDGKMSPNNEQVQKLEIHTIPHASTGFDLNFVDEEQAIRHALRIASHVSPFNCAAYWRVEELDGVRRARRLYQEGNYPLELLKREKGTSQEVFCSDHGLIPLVLREEQPIYIDNYQENAFADEAFLGTNLHESCYIPIHLYNSSGKHLVGILVAVNFQTRIGSISPQAVSMLEAAVYQLQVSLQHHDAVIMLEQLYSLQKKLYNGIRSVSQARSVQEATSALFFTLQHSFEVQSGLLGVREASGSYQLLGRLGWTNERCSEMLEHLSMFHAEDAGELDVSHIERVDREVAASVDLELGTSCVVTPLSSLGVHVGYVVCEWAHPIAPQIEQTVYQLCTVFTGVYTSLVETEHANKAKVESLSTLGMALESRDGETFGHTQRVVQLMTDFMKELSLDSQTMGDGVIGAYLHDIGKISIPDSVLLKPGALTPMERKIIETHTVQGYEIARRLSFVNERSLSIILSHHERWDGEGYPNRLREDNIPLLARMFSLIDVYDALTHERPYKSAWSKEQTVEYLMKMAGHQFDPELAEKFVAMISRTATGN